MSNSTDSRRYPKRPLVGVGALIIDGDRILLVERGQEPLKGWWSLPGGLLELGEKLTDAICREVLEETGLIVEPVAFHEIFERIIPGKAPDQPGKAPDQPGKAPDQPGKAPDQTGDPEYHYVLIDYVCRVTGGSLAAASDASRAVWIPRQELNRYGITEGTLAVIERAFGKLRC